MNWKFWQKQETEEQPQRARRPNRRRFAAARTDRLVYGWDTVPETIDRDLKYQLRTLTTRARDLAKNDDYVRRFIRVSKNNIIGPRGIELRAQYRINGNVDKNAIEAVESAWKEWGRKGVCEVSGRMSWHDCENLFVEQMAKDGEILILKQPTGPYALQLQFIDPMTMNPELCKKLDGDREIVMGVEIDQRTRRPLAYWVHVNESNNPDTFVLDGKRYRRLPADMVLHCFRIEETYQTRGYTPMASAIRRLKMLNGYEEAALTAARAGAAKMGFYTNSGDQPYSGDDEEEDGEIIEDFEAGTISQLPRGWDIKPFDTGWPNMDHADYLKAVLRGIASGIGVSYNTLANDLEGVNFSSIRSGTLEDREEWKGAQRWLADAVHQPVFETFLERAILAGKIRIKGQPVSVDRWDRFRQVTWQGRRWDWVDPQKDMQANTSAIDYCIRSISDVIRERGQDPEEVFAEIQRDNETLASLGIEVIRNGNNLSTTETADAES